MHPNRKQELTDQELVAAFRQGQPAALDLLYDKYAPVLLGLATRIVRNSETAEAVLQDTFVAIWEQKANYDASRLSLLSWLILITRDMAVAALKSGKYKNIIKSPELLKFANETEIDTIGQVNRKVKASFSNLEENEKVVLDLIYLKGYNCAEAAAELSISEETLRSWLKMAGKHLREERGN